MGMRKSKRNHGLSRSVALVAASLMLSAPADASMAAVCSGNGNGNGDGSGNGVGVGSENVGNASGNGSGSGSGSGSWCGNNGAGGSPTGSGIHRCNGNGNGSCVLIVDAPILGATVSHEGRRVTVVVELPTGADGTIFLGASKGDLHAVTHHHGKRYTFTASQAGTWTIRVAFSGRHGWKSQRIVRTVAVP